MINWSQALEMTGGDESLLGEVIEAFQEESPMLLVSIREAITTGDTDLLHRAAHTLKNSLLSLGATQSGETAFALEMLARDARLDGAQTLCETLEADLPRICQELRDRP